MAKENNGKAARKRVILRLVVVFITFCTTTFLYLVLDYWLDSLLPPGHRDSPVQRLRPVSSPVKMKAMNWMGVAKMKERENNNEEEPQLFFGDKGGEDPVWKKKLESLNNRGGTEDDILSGYLHLISIRVDTRELMVSTAGGGGNGESHDTPYQGIYGTFCRLHWKLHKYEPSSYPMFRDLLHASEVGCEKTKLSDVPIHEIIQKVRKYDTENENVDNNEKKVGRPLHIGGVVFHESRCGSTLVANLLTSVHPEENRVYSESGPPLTSLKACGEDYEHCSIETTAAIVRDVLYLMSRSDNPSETSVFFKIQSVGTRNIDAFQLAYPSTPYTFVYREPVQVMMSHLKQGIRSANCVQTRRSPPPQVQDLVRKYAKDHHDLKEYDASHLKPEQYCAAHLASLTESIVHHYQSKTGMVINYSSLPEVLYDTVFPQHYKIPVDTDAIDRMKNTATMYSKGRGKKSGEFQNDSEQKEQSASDIVKEAAKHYLLPSYLQLEEWAVTSSSAAADVRDNKE